MRWPSYSWLIICLVWLVACQTAQGNEVEEGTMVAALPSTPTSIFDALPTLIPTVAEAVPATWTAVPTQPRALELFAPPTSPPRATPVVLPTSTRPPTATPTSIPPTETASPTFPIELLTPFVTPATSTPPPVTGSNFLPNPSFENGWYNHNNTPELQVPNDWRLEWDSGFNPLDPDPWNAFVRPESRVLPRAFLPPHEHSTYIWDGTHTVKIFKREGAISFRLLTDVYLEPGTYLFEINIYPDLVVGYRPDGSKIWAPDPLSGEVQFIVDGRYSGWQLPTFGERNTMSYLVGTAEPQMVTVGVWVRGRWAIENNGWFMDAWSLRRVVE